MHVYNLFFCPIKLIVRIFDDPDYLQQQLEHMQSRNSRKLPTLQIYSFTDD